MEDLKHIIAKNIAMLRKNSGMTQFEFAEKLNYSDKAVSKWERGESIPDIIVLKEIADMFSVKVDFLLTEQSDMKKKKFNIRSIRFLNHSFITGMSIVLVWLIALVAYVISDIFKEYTFGHHYLVFLYAVPISLIVWLVMNSVWFNSRRNFLIISLLVWSLLTSLYVTFLVLIDQNLWRIFLIGIPAQIIIILWSCIRVRKKNKEE